ncbi:hypothetical protein [Frigoribacterium salinisoli]
MPVTRTNRLLSVAAVLLAAGSLSACTSDGAGGPSGTPGSHETSAPPEPGALSDEARADRDSLPIDVDEIPDWAAGALPRSDGQGPVLAQSGWLAESTSTDVSLTAVDRPAGPYAVDVACLGDGTVTVRLDPPADPASPGAPDATCSAGSISFEYDSAPAGPTVLLGLEGGPTAYAVSVTPVPDPEG